jgi:hypothetical protein
MMAETLKEAFDRVYQERWHGKRCAPVMQSQGQIAYRAVGVALLGGSAFARSVENVVAASVTAEHVKQATAAWYGKGSSPATINKRLSCLAAMGLPVEGNYKTVPKVLKWWLTPKDEERLLGFLRRRFSDMTLRDTLLRETTARLIWLTTRVGLRTEEALRLRFDDFTLNPNSATIHIRGTKTFGADATLALGPDVSTMVSAWQLMVGGTSGLVFPTPTQSLMGSGRYAERTSLSKTTRWPPSRPSADPPHATSTSPRACLYSWCGTISATPMWRPPWST